MIAETTNFPYTSDSQNDIMPRQVYISGATQYLSWMCEIMEQTVDIEAEAGAQIDAIAETGTSFMVVMEE